MEFPSFHFPPYVNPRQKKRNLFADFGVHCNIDLVSSSTELCSFLTQKCHLNSTESSPDKRYCARFPSIPLSETPICVPYPFTDKINGRLIDERKELIQFIASIRRQRAHRYHANRPNKNGKYFHLCDVVSSIEESKGDISKVKISKWLFNEYTTYTKFKEKTNIPTYNSLYCGGCVKYISSTADEHSYSILKTSGSQFDHIDLLQLSESNGLLKIDKVDTITTDDAVYQLDANLGFCVARKSQECVLLSMDSSNERSPLNVEKISDEKFESSFTDVSLSPYIAGECLLSTESGDFYFWNLDGSFDVILKEKPHRFDCDDKWRSCHFGAHPRQIVTVDRTVMELYDIRGPARNSIDLFALPSQYLDIKERIMVTKHHPINDFYHLVATDYSLIVIDERFPNNPVLQWYHALQYPPQYLSILDNINSEPREDLVILASQRPAETCCFQMKAKENFPPQSSCPQWKVCKIGDFFQFGEYHSGTDNAIIKERFNTSLSGIESFHLKSESSFVTVQMDSYGEIFYQIYSQTEEDVDKTMGSGPGSQSIELPNYVKPITTKWMSKLHEDLDKIIYEMKDSTTGLSVDATSLRDKVFLQRQPHVLCKICMPDPELDEEVDFDEMLDVCLRCGLTLQEGARITDSVAKSEIIKQDLPDFSELNLKVPAAHHYSEELADTRILMKVWNGEGNDITDLLQEKDEEIQNRKKKRKKDKVHKTSGSEHDSKTEDRNVCDDDLDKRSEKSLAESQVSDSEINREIGDSPMDTNFTSLKPTPSMSTPTKVGVRQRELSTKITEMLEDNEMSTDDSILENSKTLKDNEQIISPYMSPSRAHHSSKSSKRHRRSSESSVSSRMSQRSVLSEPCFQNLPYWLSSAPKKISRQSDILGASESKTPLDPDMSIDPDESLFDESTELFSSTCPSSVPFAQKNLKVQPEQSVVQHSNFNTKSHISHSSSAKKKKKKFTSGF